MFSQYIFFLIDKRRPCSLHPTVNLQNYVNFSSYLLDIQRKNLMPSPGALQMVKVYQVTKVSSSAQGKERFILCKTGINPRIHEPKAKSKIHCNKGENT